MRLILDFEEAREIASALASDYSGPGTFHVAEYGHEDELFAHVLVGAREWLVDRDAAFSLPDDEVVLVNLVTGDLSFTNYGEVGDYLDEMPVVGDWPDDE